MSSARPRLKDLGRWLSGGTPPKDDELAWQGDVPWLSAKDIDGTVLRSPSAFITADAAARHSKVVPPSTILIIVRGMALAHGLPVVLTEATCAFNQDLRGLVPKPGIEPRFLYYAFVGNRHRWASHIDKAAHGTARVIDSIYGERIHLPGLREQRNIVDLLDRETARIDAVLAQLSRFRELSEEFFASRLHELLLSSEPRVRLGRVCTLQRGMDLPDERRLPGDVPVIGSGGPVGTHSESPIRGPGVVTGRYGSVGAVHFVVEGPYWPLNTTLYVRDFKGNDPRWVYYLLRALPLKGESAKSAVPGLHRADAHRLEVTAIEGSAQKDVVQRLDAAAARVSRMQTLVTRTEHALEHYRDALITEAVSGDLNVAARSEAQAPKDLEVIVAARAG